MSKFHFWHFEEENPIALDGGSAPTVEETDPTIGRIEKTDAEATA